MAKKKIDTDGRLQEILGFIMCFIGLFLLLSFVPPSYLPISREGPLPSNMTGPVGELVSSTLTGIAGIAAPVFGILCILFGWNRLRKNRPGRMVKSVLFLSSMSVVIISFLALFRGGGAMGGERIYGMTGILVSKALVDRFGFIGTCMVLAFIASIVLVVTTGFSLSMVALAASRVTGLLARMPVLILGATLDLYQRIVDWRRRLREDRAKKRVKERLRGGLRDKRKQSGMKQRKVDTLEVPDDREEPIVSRKKREVVGTPPATDMPETVRPKRPRDYVLPDISLLDDPEHHDSSRSEEELAELGSILVSKLADFNIRGEIVNVTIGPVLSTFEFRPASGIKVSQIAGLSDDLALAMEVTQIRIVAPLPGKGAVGIEVPNPSKELVSFKEILSSGEAVGSKAEIPIALGKSSSGEPVVFDLVRMPHLLIAGSTGSGKSQCIHTIIMSILMSFSPEEVRLLMIDPKVLELLTYKNIPHLLTPVVTEAKGAVKSLKWLIAEMEERYRLLASIGVRNISDYNRKVSVESDEDLDGLPPGESMKELTELPYIIMIIDELADLILTLQNEIEEPLARLAQMARGVGIHLVLATQRPSVDVLTGMIKANFPSRISFRVATRVDSRTILDCNGAERLLGAGDMLFLPAGKSTPRRVHGSYITNDEIGRVIAFIRRHSAEQPSIDESILTFGREESLEEVADEQDELYWEAAKLVMRTGHGSTSLLQRKLKIGYSRAARIVDQLEEAGILGPQVGSKGREVLVDEEFIERAMSDPGRE